VRVCIVPMMKAIVSVYYLSFLVRLAVLVGTRGSTHWPTAATTRRTTGRHGPFTRGDRSLLTSRTPMPAGIGKLWPGAAQTKIPEAGMTILPLAFDCGLPQAGANTSR
jgi:hypothetical protein